MINNAIINEQWSTKDVFPLIIASLILDHLLVFSHGNLGINFFDEINDNRHNDEKSCAADSERGAAGKTLHDERQYCDYTEKQSTDKSDASNDAT